MAKQTTLTAGTKSTSQVRADPGDTIRCENCQQFGEAATDRRYHWTCEKCAQRNKRIHAKLQKEKWKRV